MKKREDTTGNLIGGAFVECVLDALGGVDSEERELAPSWNQLISKEEKGMKRGKGRHLKSWARNSHHRSSLLLRRER